MPITIGSIRYIASYGERFPINHDIGMSCYVSSILCGYSSLCYKGKYPLNLSLPTTRMRSDTTSIHGGHMPENELEKPSKATRHTADHLANERTFLSWLRTCIGIMAFGFVVERFALFSRQMTLLLGNAQTIKPPGGSQWLALFIGELLVFFAIVIGLLSFIQYKQISKQIENDIYYPSTWLSGILIFLILIVGGCLTFYLFYSYSLDFMPWASTLHQ
jgi:putative membrane protein